MKKQVVIDSSVVVKWFDEKEENSSQAMRILEVFVGGRIEVIIPDLLFYEVGNIFLKKWPTESYKMKKSLDKLWRLPWVLMPLRKSLLDRTLEIADQCKATFYDALFLATAESTGAELVTADLQFLKKTGNFPFAKPLSSFQ